MNEKHLDYIQASLFFDESKFIENRYKSAPKKSYYSRGYIDANGTTYHFGNPKSNKCLVTMSGRPLEILRSDGFTDCEIVCSLKKRDAKITRLDMALTQYVSDDLITIEDVKNWWKEGRITSSLVKHGARFISSFDDENGERPETFYVGSMEKRGKQGIFRAYNKGIQLNLGDYLITRLEYEDRGDKADMSAERIAQGHDMGSVFKSRFDVSDERFQALCDAPAIDISRGAAKPKSEADESEEKRWAWLMTQVAPAIREMLENPKDAKETDAKMTQFLTKAGLFNSAMKTRRAIVDLNNE
jgi:DNA relaxase NicK